MRRSEILGTSPENFLIFTLFIQNFHQAMFGKCCKMRWLKSEHKCRMGMGGGRVGEVSSSDPVSQRKFFGDAPVHARDRGVEKDSLPFGT